MTVTESDALYKILIRIAQLAGDIHSLTGKPVNTLVDEIKKTHLATEKILEEFGQLIGREI